MKFENKGKWLRQISEARSIDKDNVISKDGKYYHKLYGYEVELRDGKFHKADTRDNASKSTNDRGNADWAELRKLASLKAKMNTLKDAYDKETDILTKSKIKVAMKQLEDSIAVQEEVVSSSNEVNKDINRTKQISKLIDTK